MKKQNSYDDLDDYTNIPQWQQNIVLDRIENSTEFMDAFEMVALLKAKEDLETEKDLED